MRTEGKHIIMDASGCVPELLNDLDYLRSLLVDAARRANATVLNVAFHHFTPQGVSGVVVISESHLSIHTWPEFGYAALDFYTCGDIDPKVACEYVAKELKATYVKTTEIARGEVSEEGKYSHKTLSVKEKVYGEELSLLP